ncbi:hypothetical protein [Dehalogenimonas etheniformans]|uniref:Uncharacterized protein n=1 Tax=Dehalogenimonas etheniformans TaxID=1536648 RepID=A0A2P5P4T3_9CHLR|nr:hypothetical protein [Dehalogenimonas etheniformans]PPD57304.1 hypothetical protein JP09_009660 [Dehalogenimonas etheniformans]QNT77020.1 hypothetical protein HX448_10205 [Dehalogenimonas etheniformans]
MCGSSVILGTLGLSLKCHPQFEVITLNELRENGRLRNLNPDIIFFDLNSQRPRQAFTLLGENPELTIVGVSPDTNVVKVWSGKQLKELSTAELMRVIDQNDQTIKEGVNGSAKDQ